MRARRLLAAVLAVTITPLLAPPATAAPTALPATITTSSANTPYTAANATDGDQATYWESRNHALPQWAQADLGAARPVDRLVLKLPTHWERRTQTITVQASSTATDFTDLTPATAHVFDPAAGNTATITLPATTTRYLRLTITANTAWPAAQLAELQIHGPTDGDTQPPTAPTNLTHTQPATDQIRLTWTAATDNTAVTAYDIYANGQLRTSVPADTRTHTDTQPPGTAVTYFIRARDAAGNQSADSNTTTRGGTTTDRDLAAGKTPTASSHTQNYLAAHTTDGNVGTYWEANGHPATITVPLGANHAISSVVIRLNPDPVWARRTQTIQLLGRDQNATDYRDLTPARDHTFDPATSNIATIPVTATTADLRLRFTANTGAPGGQIAELQIMGAPAANPDLTITDLTATPTSPVEGDDLTLSATVTNTGTLPAPATTATFYLGDTEAATATVGPLAPGASTTARATAEPRDAGTYPLSAKVDEPNTIVEQNETNNATTANPVTITPVPTADLITATSWAPTTPAPGTTTTFTVAIKNQGTTATTTGPRTITLTVLDAAGEPTRTLTATHTATHTGAIATGATTTPITLGTWTAATGRHTIRTTVTPDANEIPAKHPNNTATTPLFVGRGANMPYDLYEAEDATTGGGATRVGPNRTVGDLAGEASGRRAVTLNTTGAYVEFTTRATTNTLVTRFSIPDAPGGGGITTTLNIYVNDTFHKAIPLTSRYAWLYGAEANPGNTPGPGPRHIYDEANLHLDTTIPAGSKIKLQKDAANTSTYAIDFISLEHATPRANPDPTRYTTPTGFTHQDVQNALDRVRMDTTGTLTGVYLPRGDYQTTSKFQVYGKPIRIIGAGPWYTRFHAPTGQENTDIGFRADATANGSTFAHFAYFGNYTTRIDGPGKVFDFANVADMTIADIWNEHMVCLYWGANTDRVTIRDSRIRNMFADAINMTNGSTDNHVHNNESRASGDDSFALFSAIDAGGADMKDNLYENLTSILTWRAAGIAVYGGYGNTFRNIHIADTLVYSGVTISSLDFGYPMNGFGADPPTRLENISIVRAGGHFWGSQTFPGIWVFSASKVFQGIRVSDVDIIDPTYSGIMFQTNYVGGQPQFPVRDTTFTDITITGARRSGDAWDAKSGFGIWANELPEPGQGPAVGSVTFTNLRMSGNDTDIRNTTSTFTITVN